MKIINSKIKQTNLTELKTNNAQPDKDQIIEGYAKRITVVVNGY